MCHKKANHCNMDSEYSNGEPIKLRKSLYTILCHLIITFSLQLQTKNFKETQRAKYICGQQMDTERTQR